MYFIVRCILVDQLSQDLSVFSQFAFQQGVQTRRVFGAKALGKTDFGHNTVTLDQVVNHVPLATVVYGIGEQAAHGSAVQGVAPFSRLDNVVQKVITTLDLWKKS